MFLSVVSVVKTHFSFKILFIWILFFSWLVLLKVLSILCIFSKNKLLVWLIFSVVFLFSVLLIYQTNQLLNEEKSLRKDLAIQKDLPVQNCILSIFLLFSPQRTSGYLPGWLCTWAEEILLEQLLDTDSELIQIPGDIKQHYDSPVRVINGDR